MQSIPEYLQLRSTLVQETHSFSYVVDQRTQIADRDGGFMWRTIIVPYMSATDLVSEETFTLRLH